MDVPKVWHGRPGTGGEEEGNVISISELCLLEKNCWEGLGTTCWVLQEVFFAVILSSKRWAVGVTFPAGRHMHDTSVAAARRCFQSGHLVTRGDKNVDGSSVPSC